MKCKIIAIGLILCLAVIFALFPVDYLLGLCAETANQNQKALQYYAAAQPFPTKNDITRVLQKEDLLINNKKVKRYYPNGTEYVIEKNGVLWAKGGHDYSQTGIGNKHINFVYSGSERVILSRISDLAVYRGGWSNTSTLALDIDGNVYGWGDNSDGQILPGGKDDYAAPIMVLSGAKKVFATGDSTYAIMQDGTLAGWGSIAHATDIEDKDEKIEFPWAKGISDIQGDFQSLLFLNDKGQVFSIKLVEGKIPMHAQPQFILDNISMIRAPEGQERYALSRNGLLYMWGMKSSSETKTRNNAGPEKPEAILQNVISFDAAYGTTAAISSDHTLYAWGANYGGAIKEGGEDFIKIPAPIANDVLEAYISDGAIIIEHLDGKVETRGYDLPTRAINACKDST